MHAKGVGQLVRGVAHQREMGLAHGIRRFVPDLVREMRVGGDDVDLGASLLEFGVVFGRIFHFSGAVEGESSGHENHDRPLALQAGFGHFDELAVVESLSLEWLNCGIDK